MPIYEYQCIKCKEPKEIIHSIKDRPVFYCKDCGNIMVKLISSSTTKIVINGIPHT